MANWLNVYQKEIEPSPDAIENAENRKNFLLHLKYYLLNTFVKHNKSELKIWLLQALGNLQIDSRTKSKKIRALFYERENRNYEFERSVLKLIVSERPSAIAKLFRSDYRIFKNYFQSGDSEARIKKWFDWFAYEHVNTKYGAAALQSFAFKNRNDVWDRFLVWSTKRSVTPVIAVVQPWLMMQLDIVATVKNLLDDPREEFWTSSELEDSLSNGEFLKVLDSDYFTTELTKILNGERTDELRKELKSIIDVWMDEFSFESVCKSSFHSLNDEQLLQVIKDLISPKNSPKQFQAYLTQLPTLEEILLYNGLTDEFRATFVKNLLAEESKESRAIIDNLINSILSITNEEQRQMDEISHWALKKRLKSERKQTANKDFMSNIEFECLLLEIFMINYRIASHEPNREALEALMTRAGLHFEAVEEESFKRRKKHKKDKKKDHSSSSSTEERKIKKVFIGWHVLEFDETTKPNNNNGAKEESNAQNSVKESQPEPVNNKRKIDAATSSEATATKNTYAMKEVPYLLSKLFVRSSLEYAMSQ